MVDKVRGGILVTRIKWKMHKTVAKIWMLKYGWTLLCNNNILKLSAKPERVIVLNAPEIFDLKVGT